MSIGGTSNTTSVLLFLAFGRVEGDGVFNLEGDRGLSGETSLFRLDCFGGLDCCAQYTWRRACEYMKMVIN